LLRELGRVRKLKKDFGKARAALAGINGEYGLPGEVDQLTRFVGDARTVLGSAGVDVDRALRASESVVLQVVELKRRLRTIHDRRLRVPEQFRAVWEVLYKKAQRTEDWIVRDSLTTLGRRARVPTTRAVHSAITYLDKIEVIVIIAEPRRERDA